MSNEAVFFKRSSIEENTNSGVKSKSIHNDYTILKQEILNTINQYKIAIEAEKSKRNMVSYDSVSLNKYALKNAKALMNTFLDKLEVSDLFIKEIKMNALIELYQYLTSENFRTKNDFYLTFYKYYQKPTQFEKDHWVFASSFGNSKTEKLFDKVFMSLTNCDREQKYETMFRL